MLAPILAHAQWGQRGNALQGTADGYKFRTNLGSQGFAYWYTKGQIDSIETLYVTIGAANTNYLRLSGSNQTVTQIPTFTNSVFHYGSIVLANTVNNGVIVFNNQTALPQAGTAGLTVMYHTSIGMDWLNSTGFVSTQYMDGITGNRTYTWPDSSGRVVLQQNLLLARNAANFGLTASLADVGHYTLPNTGDQTIRVGGWVNLLSVSGSDAVVLQVTYTDNHSVVKTKSYYPQGSVTSALTTADDYPMPTMDFRVKSGTNIQVSAVVTGTGTITYEVGCTIGKLVGN